MALLPETVLCCYCVISNVSVRSHVFLLSLSYYLCTISCNSSYLLGPLWKSPLDNYAKYLQKHWGLYASEATLNE